MADIYVAKAAVVKVSIGSAGGNRIARFIRSGGVIPEGVDAAALAALAKRGLIAKVKAAPAPSAAAAAKAKADAAAKEAADQAAADKAAAEKADAEAAAKAADAKTATK